MIGRLQGTLLSLNPPEVLLDVNGVGYEVLVPLSTLANLPGAGETVVLHTHFVVREDAQVLYGFEDLGGRALFRELIRVNGVGPKMALAILSGMDRAAFLRCVHAGDIATLVKLPGVGKKTAERLLVEMRDRLAGWGEAETGVAQSPPVPDQRGEAEAALIALGYKPAEAAKLVSKVPEECTSSDEIIRQALKAMVK